MKNNLTLSFALVASLVLAACQSTTSSIQDPNYRTKNGAATGAIAGALIGGMFAKDDHAEGALRGALIGGLVGGGIGANLDAQAADMRNRLGNPYVTVTNMGSYLLVNLPDDVLFASGSATLQPALQGEISSIAANLVTYPKSTIEVVGHTDSVGSEAMNMDLSQRRAYSVANIRRACGPCFGLWAWHDATGGYQRNRCWPRPQPPCGNSGSPDELIPA